METKCPNHPAGHTKRPKTCIVSDCKKRYFARGFCAIHHQRWFTGRLTHEPLPIAYGVRKGCVFGHWTVHKIVIKNNRYERFCRCTCVCGKKSDIPLYSLVHKKSSHCGCIRNPIRLRPYESLYNMLLATNKERWPVKISYNEFIKFTDIGECHYCGFNITWATYNIRGKPYNLDRKDNNMSYTINNVVVCCANCNKRKGSSFTYDEFLEVGKLIKKWRINNEIKG